MERVMKKSITFVSWGVTQMAALIVAIASIVYAYATKHSHKLFEFSPLVSFYNKHVSPINIDILLGKHGRRGGKNGAPTVIHSDLIAPLMRSRADTDRDRDQPLRLLVSNCGPAYEAIAIAQQLGPRVSIVATDVSQTMLGNALANVAKERADKIVTVQYADATQLPFDDHTFDGVLSIGGLKYFSDPARGLQEFARVLRPNGRALIIDVPREGVDKQRAWFTEMQTKIPVSYRWILPLMLPLAKGILPTDHEVQTWIAQLNDSIIGTNGQRFVDKCSCEYARLKDLPYFKVIITKQ